LDELWDRELQTVSKNFSQATRALDSAHSVGIIDSFPAMGPFPVADTFGMKAAVVMLLKSLDVGKYASNIQFSTMRKMHSVFSNIHHAPATGISGSTVMAKNMHKLLVTDCPTYGVWFDHFAQGCHKRMGDIIKPDQALSLAVLHQILQDIENDWCGACPME
jgi:hypothetical protein